MDFTRRKKSVGYFKKKYINSCIVAYERLIKSHYTKKELLEVFYLSYIMFYNIDINIDYILYNKEDLVYYDNNQER